MSPWLAIPFAILLIWLWITARALARIRAQIDEAESRLARRFYGLQGRVTEMDATLRNLEFEHKRSRGEIRFRPETPLSDALSVHPRIREILAAFRLAGSGCPGGGVDESRTLAQACRESNLDLRPVLEALDRFVKDPDAPIEARASAAKLYSIGESRTPGR